MKTTLLVLFLSMSAICFGQTMLVQDTKVVEDQETRLISAYQTELVSKLSVSLTSAVQSNDSAKIAALKEAMKKAEQVVKGVQKGNFGLYYNSY